MNQKIAEFLKTHAPATPCLVVDLDQVARNYRRYAAILPGSPLFYAIKANPAPEILDLLAQLGSGFDAASLTEVRQALAAGAKAETISFGSTIKRASEIAASHALGVKLFAFDCLPELEKIAAHAPKADVFCRVLVSNDGAEWPLSRKFGCEAEEAVILLKRARDLNLNPVGVSFHVGSQQRNPAQWDSALSVMAKIFADLRSDGIELELINLGGGFPTRYRRDIPSPEAYGDAIFSSLSKYFGNHIPKTALEPGRALVGDAGVIQSEVILVSKRMGEDRRWVYLDVGKFHGLTETMDEAIQYDISSDRTGPLESVVIAGPTCDSADVLYEKADYKLPADLALGDKVLIHATGAYTTTYSSVGFNGFPPLAAYCI